MQCEELIIKRFLEIFNTENHTNFSFENCIKKDETLSYRRIKTYDYECEDLENKIKIGIEIKRLIPHHRKRIKNLNMRVKNIKEQLEGRLKGNFLLGISLYEFKYRRNKTLRRIFEEIRKGILSLCNTISTGEWRRLSCCDGTFILKLSEEESRFNLRLCPISFASASEREIKKSLNDALKKFEADLINNRKNIILLVELIESARRTEIAGLIESLEGGFDEDGNYTGRKKDFGIINEIYHIAISNDSIIARVYPEAKECGFFSSKDIKKSQDLYSHCLDYFLH